MEKDSNWQTLINFRPRRSCAEAEVVRLETAVKVELPEDYRDFLLSTDGGYCDDGFAPCQEPTPFGELTKARWIRAGLMCMMAKMSCWSCAIATERAQRLYMLDWAGYISPEQAKITYKRVPLPPPPLKK